MTAAATASVTTGLDRRTRLGVAALLLAAFLGQFESFVIVVALPQIQQDLGADFGEVQLAAAVFVFACAAGLVIGGRAGDRYGRRRMFLASVVFFTISTLVCALATGPALLIGARLGQGIGAAVMIPQVLSLLRVVATDPVAQARAVGGYGVAMGAGVVAGLSGGGLLIGLDVGGLGWRLAFLAMIPAGALILLGGLGLPESRDEAPQRLDVAGAVLTLLCLPSLLTPLMLGPAYGWPGWIWLFLAAGAVLAVILLVQQRRGARRGVDVLFAPRLLGVTGFPTSMVTLLVLYAGNAGWFLILTYHLQRGLDLSPIATGLAFAPLGVGFALGSATSGRLASRNSKQVAVGGAALAAISMLGAAASVALSDGPQIAALAVLAGTAGAGQGLIVAPLLAGILGLTSVRDVGAVVGIANTVIQFGLVVGFAVTGVAYQSFGASDPAGPEPTGGSAGTAFASTALMVAAAAGVTALLSARLFRLGAFSGTESAGPATN
ncbi:MFS transporter [Micromonospora echinospora]